MNKRILILFSVITFALNSFAILPGTDEDLGINRCGEALTSSSDEIVTEKFHISLGFFNSVEAINHANTAFVEIAKDVEGLSFDFEVLGRKSLIVKFSGPKQVVKKYSKIYILISGLDDNHGIPY